MISPEDPGVANWLDSGGRTEGYMSLRWVPAGLLEVSTRVEKRVELLR